MEEPVRCDLGLTVPSEETRFQIQHVQTYCGQSARSGDKCRQKPGSTSSAFCSTWHDMAGQQYPQTSCLISVLTLEGSQIVCNAER